MSALPPNWTIARVGDLIDLGPRNDCPDDTKVGFVPLQRLGVDYRSRHSYESRTWSAVKKGYTHFADGDVLLARITPSFENGKAGIVRDLPNGIGAGSTEYFVCRPIKDALLAEYLLAHFKTPRFLRDGEQVMSGAVGQQRVPKRYVLDSEILLAPLTEQKRIADKLDTVLSRVDACRERLDRVPDILKRFRKSVLAAATSGKLTEEWRTTAETPDWREARLDELCHSITDGDHQAPPQVDRGVPFITISAINDGRLRVEKASRFVPRAYFEQLRPERRPKMGDVLFSVTGSIGIPALVDTENPFTFQRHIAILRPNSSIISSKYLLFAMGSERVRQQGMAAATGSAQLTIPLTGLRSFVIYLPPTAEQDEIVRRVESLFDHADRLEVCYIAARAQVQRLTPAILAKAFRGELVPQDPNDEPASALLNRIHAQRQAISTKLERSSGGGRHKKTPTAEVTMLNRKDIRDTPHLTAILKKQGPLTAEALWSASQLDIDDFYDQLKDEEARGLLKEQRGDTLTSPRLLEAP